MTFSVVARVGDAYGVAVASKFLAVGAIVPEVRSGVGAVATQSWARVAYRRELLDLLDAGVDASDAIAQSVASDDGADTRQLGVVGTDAATFTGSGCMDWAGGVSGRSDDGQCAWAIQGNILVGPQVVQEMERAWLESDGQELPERLLTALAAGDQAGGDARGRQSAALLALQPGAGYDGCGIAADLRVDDHADPVTELGRLLEEWLLYFGRPEDVQPLDGDLAREVADRLARLGHPAASGSSNDLHAALASWAGEHNYESRLSPDGIDARVLERLRAGG